MTRTKVALINIQKLTPKTRQQKYPLAKEISDKVNSMNLSGTDQVDVITLALKQLNVIDQIRFLRKPKKRQHTSDQKTDKLSGSFSTSTA